MGFFNDLKSDISQAVNEMVPGEEVETEAMETFEEVAEANEETVSEEKALDLDELLDNLDEEEPVKEEPVKEVKVSGRASDETAVITNGMSISGDIVSSGNLELMGSVRGNISLQGKLNVIGTIEGDSKASEIYAEGAKITGEVNSQGSVKIGQSSVIIGNIFATSAVIAGAVKGDIDVKGPVVLDTSAIVMGNIKSKSVQINNGAVIEGICSQCYAEVSPTTFFDELKKNKK